MAAGQKYVTNVMLARFFPWPVVAMGFAPLLVIGVNPYVSCNSCRGY